MKTIERATLLVSIVAIGISLIAIVLASVGGPGGLYEHENAPTMSFSWAQSAITLKPTESANVAFTNSDNVAMQLTVTDISAPADLVPYIVATPSTILPNTTQMVSVQFIHVPTSILENIVPDTYSVRIDDLLVYMDLTTSVTPPENVWAVIDSLSQRLGTLENSSLAGTVNTILRLDNLKAEIALLKQAPANTENFATMLDLDNVWAQAQVMVTQQQQKTDNEIAAAKAEASSTAIKYAIAAAVLAIVGTMLILRQYGRRLGVIPPEKRLTEDPPKIVKED